jgi:hypothetical protein
MTTEQETSPGQGASEPVPRKQPVWPTVWITLAVVVLLVIAYNARIGAVSPRVRTPGFPDGPAPRPVEPLFGFTHWIALLQIGTVLMAIQVIALFVWAWRRYPRHPYILMGIVTTLIVWQDPIMNWAPFAVYNPDLAHWPEDWPLVSLSPTVEPFVVIGYVTFYFLPFFPANWFLKKLQAKYGPEAFVSRHPLISLTGFILVFGFIFDMFLEVSLIRTGMYIYDQVIPFGSIFAGTPWQFPLIWESTLITLVMIPAGVLVYRDDTGRTVAERLARRAKIFPKRPALGMFTMMFVILNISYFCYGWGFQAIKVSGAATSVACPWPYPEAKVYDPQGYYEQNGQPGPYSVGIWSTWMSGQPDGRPHVAPPADGGRCAPAKQNG